MIKFKHTHTHTHKVTRSVLTQHGQYLSMCTCIYIPGDPTDGVQLGSATITTSVVPFAQTEGLKLYQCGQWRNHRPQEGNISCQSRCRILFISLETYSASHEVLATWRPCTVCTPPTDKLTQRAAVPIPTLMPVLQTSLLSHRVCSPR